MLIRGEKPRKTPTDIENVELAAFEGQRMKGILTRQEAGVRG